MDENRGQRPTAAARRQGREIYRLPEGAPRATPRAMAKHVTLLLPVFLLPLLGVACSETRTNGGSDDAGRASQDPGQNAPTYPSSCTPQPKNQAQVHCEALATDGSEPTLYACDPSVSTPPEGCTRTTLASSFCCPTPRAIPTPDEGKVLCARRCGDRDPAACEDVLAARLADPVCGDAAKEWLTCAVGAHDCADAATQCAPRVADYFRCKAEDWRFVCTVSTPATQYCAASQGPIAVGCTTFVNSTTFGHCEEGTSDGTMPVFCCEASIL